MTNMVHVIAIRMGATMVHEQRQKKSTVDTYLLTWAWLRETHYSRAQGNRIKKLLRYLVLRQSIQKLMRKYDQTPFGLQLTYMSKWPSGSVDHRYISSQPFNFIIAPP